MLTRLSAWRRVTGVVALVSALASAAGVAPLEPHAEVTLPSPPARFDYAALDPQTGYLWLNQMGADRTLVFDPVEKVTVGTIGNLEGPTGITLAPERRLGFISSSGDDTVAVVNLDTLTIERRLTVGGFPDGSAWVPSVGRLFVSNEVGGTVSVIGGATLHVEREIPLGGEAGNSVYDPEHGRVLVNVQTRGEIAVVDPRTLRVTQRVTLPASCRHNHGLLVDPADDLAFVACDGNSVLLVLALRDLHSIQEPLPVGMGPDVMALDRSRRLVVASESGLATVFAVEQDGVRSQGMTRVGLNAHVVLLDAGLAYFPLRNVDGAPVLRIMRLPAVASGYPR